MPLGAIGLLLVSAALHTTWNLLLKSGHEKYMATWWAMLIGSLLFLPVLFFTGLPTHVTWLLMFISAFVEAAYFVILAYAYEDSEFSLVYPLARGAAPALIALWSVLFLHEHLTAGGTFGLVTIVVGLMVVGGSGAFRLGGKPNWRGIVPALVLALCISIYTVIDGAAVKLTTPFAYAALIYFVSAAYMTPYIVRKHGWIRLGAEFRQNGWRLAAIGALIVTAYLMALWAYRISTVSYSGAIREVGVVMGALAGWRLLGEKLGGWRVVGAVVIFGGILIIAMLG
jgi:drug/metabolite transporter (DMT)-like permease